MWGISFVATKVVLRELSPVTLIFSRFALGTLLLQLMLALRGEPALPPRADWGALALMGLVGVFAHQMLQVHGLTLTSAVHAGWLVGLTPIWTALLAGLFLRERFGRAKAAGLVVGCAGAILVVTQGRVGQGVLALPSTRGDLLVMASNVNWAIYTTLGHPTLRKLGSRRATAGAMLLGWLMLVPLFVWRRGWQEYGGLTGGGIAALLFLGIGCSGLGYLFWYGALERIEASRVAAFLYIEPLVTVAAAAVVLGEAVRGAIVAGGMLVLTGVAMVQRAGNRR